jgi:hypothetical protein
MEVPQNKSKLDGGKQAIGRPAAPKILYPRFYTRKIGLAAAVLTLVVGCTAFLSTGVAAQEDRPQITPGERRAPRKKDSEPRAVAILQLGSSGKASLVPIAILINGKFWDASAYKAAPVPMALDAGTVYEAERTGSSLGLFTVATALHANAVNAPMPWLGTGDWKPLGSEPEKKPQKAESAPVGLDKSEGPPRLTKNPNATNSAPGSSQSPNASASVPSSTPTPSSAPSSSSGDEPPRLSRPAESQTPSNNKPASAPGSTPPPGDAKGQSGSSQTGSNQTGTSQTGSSTPQSQNKQESNPDDSKQSGNAKTNDSENITPSDSGADAANRPRLRRGKPAESFADQDIPGYSKLDAAPSASKANGAKAAQSAPVEQVQLIPAISDSGGPEPHSYGFEWLKGEEGERKAQLITLAKEQVNAYVAAQAKATITPKTAAQTTRRAAPKKPEPTLSNLQMTTYDLWSSNQPIIVFSAQAQMPPQAGWHAASEGQPAEATPDMQYSILIVAYPDLYNNLHKLYVGVTDKFHLDLTPRLELIDAVDADGDGRGELLFRETSDSGSGWVIYRATVDKLWKMYDSLNPE